MRKVIVFLTLFTFVLMCCADFKMECKIIGNKSPSLRLKRYLFCEYDSTIRPVTHNDVATNVTISLWPKFMEYVDRTSMFVLHSWVFIQWKDEHLTWNPEDYDGVESIKVKSSQIWVPDFSVYNSGDMESTQTGIPETICQLMYTGTIICTPSLKINTQCEADYTYWPYDIQTCSIRIGSWTHTGEELSLDFRRKAIVMSNFIKHKQWLISNYTSRKYSPIYKCCPNDTFPTLLLKFKLQRHSSMMHAVFITPAIVLMVITMTVLWLDSTSTERISLAAVNFICHMLCIYDLHWMLPPNGISAPHILLFYRDSMLLAMLTMIVTTLLRKLHQTKLSTPNWILAIIHLATSNRFGRFFLLDRTTISESNNNTNHQRIEESIGTNATRTYDDSWRKIAIIMEWFTFVITAITYLFLILLRVPLSD